MRKSRLWPSVASAAAGLLWLLATAATAAELSKPDDVARFIAGLPPTPGTEAARLAEDPAWQSHARSLDERWAGLERRQLSRIRAWSAANIKSPQNAALYMFSGPDFLYAHAFFPAAETYVLAGLEPVGRPPELGPGTRRSLGPALGGVRNSLAALFSYSFFITKKMKTDLRARTFTGTLPVLYLFLARTGHTIDEVSLIELDETGRVMRAQSGSQDPWKGPAKGVEIVFSGADKRARRLYYFSTDLSDSGIRTSGLVPFVERLGRVDSLIKSASYLFHSGGFTQARKLLLDHTASLVQDDSGVPLEHFRPADWELKPFGRYLGPIGEFPGRYQSRLADLFRRSASRIDFGIGYRYRPAESNLMLAVRRPAVRSDAWQPLPMR